MDRYLVKNKASAAGHIKLAKDTKTDVTVVLKFHSELSDFRRELRLVASIQHESEFVPQLREHHQGVSDKVHCFVLEGGDVLLADYAESKQLEEFEVKFIALSIAKAIVALHSKGIVYGALSTLSVMRFQGQWKLLDFDHAGKVGEKRKVPHTLAKCAPETVQKALSGKGEAELAEALDAWGLGCIMYELFNRTPLFADNAQGFDALASANEVEIPRGGIREEAALDVVSKLLKKNPAERLSMQNVLVCIR